MRVFMSYRFGDEEPSEVEVNEDVQAILKPQQFVHRVSYYLGKQPDLEVCCWSEGRDRLDWDEVIANQLETSDKFVLFLDRECGSTQETEVRIWKEKHKGDFVEHTIIVKFYGGNRVPAALKIHKYEFSVEELAGPSRKWDARLVDDLARLCAAQIYKMLHTENEWVLYDGLPVGYPFDYEKRIIEEFVNGNGRLLNPKRLQQGCPINWPEVDKIKVEKELYYDNPIPEPTIGRYRKESERIIVDARSGYHRPWGDKPLCLASLGKGLSLLEAGPREQICYPVSDYRDDLKIGIVVSGGIAPGINSVIAGIYQRHTKYQKEQEEWYGDSRKYRLTITMYRDGFSGILAKRKIVLDEQAISDHANQGGSMISTARHDILLDTSDRIERDETLDRLVHRLKEDEIDILYIIGGDGSMRAAHAIWTRIQQRRLSKRSRDKIVKPVSVVAIPKTMDNDILWVWQAFGFLSAVEKAKDFISQIDTETKSNPRLCIMQLFGSDSGFVVSHAALASGVCKAALIPEVGFTMKRLSEHIRERLEQDYEDRDKRYGQSPYGIILLAETAIPRDVEDYIDNTEYATFNLTETEKKAILDFVGSALLDQDDILNWQSLSTALCDAADGESSGPQSLKRRIWDLLPGEIQNVLRYYYGHDSGDPTEGIRSLVVKALNDVIKRHDFLGEKEHKAQRSQLSQRIDDLAECILSVRQLSQKGTNQLKKFLDYLLSVKVRKEKQANPLKADPELKLQQISTYPLPYEAKVTVESLEALMSKPRLREMGEMCGTREWKTQQDVWVRNFKGHCKLMCPELAKLYSRLLLEEVFSGSIRRKAVCGERRVHGQTPDELRSGGLKVVSAVLQSDIRRKMEKRKEYWQTFRIFVNEPRHLIRAIFPSVSDVIFGQRLGMLAVDNAMAGYTDFMVSQWMTEYVLVPLELVVLGRKRVPENGIFWKSVLANTGQWPTLV